MTVPPSSGNGGYIFIGARPPDYVPYDSLCPPAPQCTECLDQQECKYLSLAILDLIERWEVNAYGNRTYPGLPSRTTSKYTIISRQFKTSPMGNFFRGPSHKYFRSIWRTFKIWANRFVESSTHNGKFPTFSDAILVFSPQLTRPLRKSSTLLSTSGSNPVKIN